MDAESGRVAETWLWQVDGPQTGACAPQHRGTLQPVPKAQWRPVAAGCMQWAHPGHQACMGQARGHAVGAAQPPCWHTHTHGVA